MEHLTLKAVATTTDQGLFEAVISTDSVDREKDVVDARAMVAALKKWNRPIPLSWDHSTKAENIFGSIDPMTVREENGEVVARGQVDLESKVGEEAWRSFKNRTIGFSFGYLTLKSSRRQGGGRNLTELDIFEITATPTPVNNDTRVLNTKAMMNATQMAERMRAMAEEMDSDNPPDPKEMARRMREMADEMVNMDKALDDKPSDDLRDRSNKAAREVVDLPETRSPLNVEQAQEALVALEAFEPGEVKGMQDGILKAVWSAAYVNDLPDSAFLHVESGGDKDGEGKTTPRSLRHFPYKDTDGAVDLPHLRNALARIPQSSLSQDVKDRLIARAQRILDSQKAHAIEDARRGAPEAKSQAQDSLRRRSEEAELELKSDGTSLRKPPTPAKQPKHEVPSEKDLRRQSREWMLEILTGSQGDNA